MYVLCIDFKVMSELSSIVMPDGTYNSTVGRIGSAGLNPEKVGQG